MFYWYCPNLLPWAFQSQLYNTIYPQTPDMDKEKLNKTNKTRHVQHSAGETTLRRTTWALTLLSQNDEPNRKSMPTEKKLFILALLNNSLSLPVTLFNSLTDCHDRPHIALTRGHILLSVSPLQSSQLNVRCGGGWLMVGSGSTSAHKHWEAGAIGRCRHHSQQPIYYCEMYWLSFQTVACQIF